MLGTALGVTLGFYNPLPPVNLDTPVVHAKQDIRGTVATLDPTSRTITIATDRNDFNSYLSTRYDEATTWLELSFETSDSVVVREKLRIVDAAAAVPGTRISLLNTEGAGRQMRTAVVIITQAL